MHEFVSFFPSLLDVRPQEMSWETVVTTIRGNSLKPSTVSYRQALAASDRTAMKRIKQACPCIVCQARMNGGRNRENIGSYTGVFMVDFDHVPAERMADAIQLIRADRHTMVCYTTISGQGLRVIARVEGEVTEKTFKAAWLTVNEYYKRLTSLDYDTQCAGTTRVCGLAWDPQAFFNPVPQRIKVNMALCPKEARRGKGAGRPPKAANVGQRVRLTVEGDGATYADGHRNDYVSRCVYLMNRYGVAQDDCAEWALEEFDGYAATHPGAVEGIVRSVYATRCEEHATMTFSRGRATVRDVEEFVNNHYIIRRNLLSMKIEYAPRKQADGGAAADGGTVDDHFVNSLWRMMQNAGINADTQVINNILASDFVTDYHPFTSWLTTLPEWDGKTDYIRHLFSMVHCVGTTASDFHFYTRCWFLAMVASVMDDRVVNHEILTFIGRQGTYKSSFMLHILPPHLRPYFTTKGNSFQLTKDDEIMLAQNIIISLEEIDSMSAKEVNQLKAFTTKPCINTRPPYARHTRLMPRVASLCATGNNLTFLTDQTGNRRWLPFHVESIDDPWTADIPYEGLYAQALALIRSGERYWLSDRQIQRLNERNREFQAPDPATEMIVTYFTHPRTEAETKYMTASKIAARFAPLIKISPTKVGIAMAALDFEQVRTQDGRFWKVADRPVAEIDSRLPGKDDGEMPF